MKKKIDKELIKSKIIAKTKNTKMYCHIIANHTNNEIEIGFKKYLLVDFKNLNELLGFGFLLVKMYKGKCLVKQLFNMKGSTYVKSINFIFKEEIENFKKKN